MHLEFNIEVYGSACIIKIFWYDFLVNVCIDLLFIKTWNEMNCFDKIIFLDFLSR